MTNLLSLNKQIEELIAEYEEAIARSKYDDGSDVISEVELKALQTRCLAIIDRIAGQNSVYYNVATDVLSNKIDHAYGHLAGLIGVIKALYHDLSNEYLRSLEELIHGDIFTDFLEMAEYLANSGYKDSAAVISGSTLEAHLHQLCNREGISITSGAKPHRADTLNANLAKANVYSKTDQKNVTAWLGLRNDAAHGNYSAYDKSQVLLLISSVRDFITRHPA
jgi:hypothetical protein